MLRFTIDTSSGSRIVNKHIYGHFAEHLGRCIYEGIWVGEDSPIPNTRGMRNDVIAALARLEMPNLRWPGGCFADTYHWKDGVGPRSERPSIVNIHWGGTTESNAFGTHEFLDFCSLIGTEPYICGNVGSGTVQEMAEWLEYLTMKDGSPMAAARLRNGRQEPWDIRLWAVGNENWGCGGNMTALQYAQEFRRFQTYCRNFSGKSLYKVACGFDDAWNETLVHEAGKFMDGISVHYYSFAKDWEYKGHATGFDEKEWFSVLKNGLGVDDFLKRTSDILDRHDSQKRIGIVLDEWGSWYWVSPGTNPGFLYQENTIRDAVLAAVSFHVFHRHERLHVANIAQTINVLQSMILTDKERMLCTPTYHVFEMFKPHQGATYLEVTGDEGSWRVDDASIPHVSLSASKAADGTICITAVNLHADKATEVEIALGNASMSNATGRILQGAALDDRNSFDEPTRVEPRPFEPLTLRAGTLAFKLPPASVLAITAV